MSHVVTWESRLFDTTGAYVRRNALAILRTVSASDARRPGPMFCLSGRTISGRRVSR